MCSHLEHASRHSSQAPWPLSYIITSECIDIYRSVFTTLLMLKRTQHLLVRSGKLKPGTTAERSFEVGKRSPKEFFPLRRRLIWVVNTLLEYYNRDVSHKTDVALLPLPRDLTEDPVDNHRRSAPSSRTWSKSWSRPATFRL